MREPIRIDDALSAWARVALNSEADRVRAAPNGSRTSTLNRAAFSLGQIVGAGVLDASIVEHVFADGAVATGLREREALLTIRSGLRADYNIPESPGARSIASTPAARRAATAEVRLDIAP